VSASPTPFRPEEQICQYNTYKRAYDFEIAELLDERAEDCRKSVEALTKLQFGPPTAWEVFNTICKGDCRAYSDRIARLLSATDCDCSRIASVRYRCPATPTGFLCEEVEYCYNYDNYITEYCAENSCGRFATNEDDWRIARAKCSGSLPLASLWIVAVHIVVAMFVQL
jgi:hypothetical protein